MATAPPSGNAGSTAPASAASESAEAQPAGQQHLPDPSKVRRGLAAPPKQIKPIPPRAKQAAADGKPPKEKVEIPGVDTGFNRASPFDQKIAAALGRKAEAADSGALDLGDSENKTRKAQAGETYGPDGELVAPAPKRGPDGKFLKAEGEGEEIVEALPAEQPAEEAEAPEVPVETPEPPEEAETLESVSAKFKALDQKHRTLQGMFKPIQLKAQEAITQQHGAAKSAIAWKAKADSLQAEIDQLKSHSGNGSVALSTASSPVGGQDQSAAPSTSTSTSPLGLHRVEEIVKAIDWNGFRSAREQGEDTAAAWLVSHVLRFADADRKRDIDQLRGEFQQFTTPIHEQGQRREIARHATEVFTRVADIKDASGEVAFPELYDEKEAEAVGKTWTQLGFDPQILLTPAGVVQAILAYRFYNGKTGQPVASPTTAAQEETEQEGGDEGEEIEGEEGEGQEGLENQDESDLNARPTRALLGSRASLPMRQPSAPGSTRDLAASIKAAMRQTSESDNIFGFPTRKSAARR